MLVALRCTKCGYELNFVTGSMFCKCASCGTLHALVASGGKGVLHPASYLPFVTGKDGKMTKNLKLQLAEKLREAKYLIVQDDWYLGSDRGYLSIDSVTGEVLLEQDRIGQIDSDLSKLIYVGLPSITRTKKLKYLGFLFRKQVEQWESTPKVDVIAKVLVKVVKMNDGKNEFLAGHRIVIKVPNGKFEEQANMLSKQIQEWFGLVPDVSLENI